MKKFLVVLVALGIFSGIQYAVKSEPFDGTWYASGMLDDEFRWKLEFTFDHHTYSMKGYPPIAEKGTFKVLRRDGQTYELERSPFDGDAKEQGTVKDTIILGEDGTTATINDIIFKRSQ